MLQSVDCEGLLPFQMLRGDKFREKDIIYDEASLTFMNNVVATFHKVTQHMFSELFHHQ